MSRRQYTTLTLSLQINLPAGETQAAFIARITESITILIGSCVIRLIDKRTTYL